MTISVDKEVEIKVTGKIQKWGDSFGGEVYIDSENLTRHKSTPLAKKAIETGGYKVGDSIDIYIRIPSKQ